MFQNKQNLSLDSRSLRDSRFKNLKVGMYYPLSFEHPTVLIPLPLYDEDFGLTPTTTKDSSGFRVLGDWIRTYPRVRVQSTTQNQIWIPFDPEAGPSPTNPVGIILRWRRSNDELLQKYARLFDHNSPDAVFKYDRDRYFFFGVIIQRGGRPPLREAPLGLTTPLLIDISKTAAEALKQKAFEAPLLPHEKFNLIEFFPVRAGSEGLSRFEVRIKNFEPFLEYHGIEPEKGSRLKDEILQRIQKIKQEKLTWASVLEEYPEEKQFQSILNSQLPPVVLYRIFCDTDWGEKLPESIKKHGKRIMEETLSQLKTTTSADLTDDEIKTLSDDIAYDLDQMIFKSSNE